MNFHRLWFLGRRASIAYRAEPGDAIVMRRSVPPDHAALERLAALESRRLPDRVFLVAEVEGEIVAATPLDLDAETLSDPFWHTVHIRELLELQATQVGRQRARASEHDLSSAGNENVMLGAESSTRP
jgi:hypothetical protein